MALWPDRSERAAGQNLRVTLSHLLDVLDPGRERSQGSHLLQESGGAIRLDPDSGLRVDLWEVQRHAGAVITASADRRSSVLAHARRLLAARTGRLLDATQIGDWYLPHQRRLDDLVLTAAGRLPVNWPWTLPTWAWPSTSGAWCWPSTPGRNTATAW